MTFTPKKPDPGPSPKNDAPTIQTNFSQYNTIFTTNHVAMNLADAGNHKTAIMEKQIDDPTIDENMATLYTKDSASNAGTEPQLFVRIPQFLPNGIPNNAMQLTYNTVNTAGPIYQSFLPGGYLFFFGISTDYTANITLVPAPTQILIATACPNVQPAAIALPISTQILSNDTFKINATGAIPTNPFSWMAIAKV